VQIFTTHPLVLLFAALASASGYAAPASAAPPKPKLTIKLRLYNYARLRVTALEQTQQEVGTIFKNIGVTAKWVTEDTAQVLLLCMSSREPQK
jgi:hypothetical protein